MADATPFKLVTGTPNKLQEFSSTDTVPTANLPPAALASGITAQATSAGLATDGSEMWFHTGEDRLYFYDVTRSEWLSVETDLLEFRVADTSGGAAKYWDDAFATGSSTEGWFAPYDGVVVAIYGRRTATTDGMQFQLHNNGSLATGATALAGEAEVEDLTLDVDFSQGDVLAGRQNASTTVAVARSYFLVRRKPS